MWTTELRDGYWVPVKDGVIGMSRFRSREAAEKLVAVLNEMAKA
jgi:hypothetical protein